MQTVSYVIQPECMRAIANHLVAGIFGTFVATSLTFGIVAAGGCGPIAGLIASIVQSLIGVSVSSGAMVALLKSIGVAGFNANTPIKVTGSSASLACEICQALGHHSGDACPT